MDRTAVIGLAATLALLGWVMLAGAGHAAHVFWRTPSVALVVGGAVLTTIVSVPGLRFAAVWGLLREATRGRRHVPEHTIITLVALAEIARREGLLALERPVEKLSDDFLRRAMRMAVDGYDATTIRQMMQIELESLDLRHTQGRSVLESMARSAPVFGMMGTLVGLVVMLGQMEDPTKIAPGMAVALLTTLYGLILANVVCWPLARRLGHRSSEELLAKTIALEGTLGVQAGDHPRIIAQKLQAYLPPERRGMPVPREVSERLMSAPTEDEVQTTPAPHERGRERELVDAA
jgi:chemotaxis protein MotA